MTTEQAARNLASSIAACRDMPREELLESFTAQVAEGFEEADFAKAFCVVHRVFHDWMAG